MSYYLRRLDPPNGASTHVWKIDETLAVRVGITNAEHSPGGFFQAEPGETIWQALRRQTPWFGPQGENPFHQALLPPGAYYPRMARPFDQHPDEAPGRNPGARDEADVLASAQGQLAALVRQLDRICQTVHPCADTLDVYGHDIRNLLILACTEAENHWRGVLDANGNTKDHLGTRDYVALQAAMRLDEYVVEFPGYPWLAPVKPFEGWGRTGNPTRDLAWYDAYNAVKHNCQGAFARGTLRHAFAAVTACAIMLEAQFGFPVGLGQRSALRDFFRFATVPAWPLTEIYIYPYGEESGGYRPVHFPFRASMP